jgi:hypothetical protein
MARRAPAAGGESPRFHRHIEPAIEGGQEREYWRRLQSSGPPHRKIPSASPEGLNG